MTNKHTLGPWLRPDDDQPHGAIAIGGDGGNQLVALVYGRTLEEKKANAELIKSVLDMLEALEAMVRHFGTVDDFEDTHLLHPEAVSASKKALAAIAKARGQA